MKRKITKKLVFIISLIIFLLVAIISAVIILIVIPYLRQVELRGIFFDKITNTEQIAREIKLLTSSIEDIRTEPTDSFKFTQSLREPDTANLQNELSKLQEDLKSTEKPDDLLLTSSEVINTIEEIKKDLDRYLILVYYLNEVNKIENEFKTEMRAASSYTNFGSASALGASISVSSYRSDYNEAIDKLINAHNSLKVPDEAKEYSTEYLRIANEQKQNTMSLLNEVYEYLSIASGAEILGYFQSQSDRDKVQDFVNREGEYNDRLKAIENPTIDTTNVNFSNIDFLQEDSQFNSNLEKLEKLLMEINDRAR